MLWLLLWVLALLLFLLIPACCTEDRRRLWWLRFQQGRWNPQVPADEANSSNAATTDEVHHYVLSKTQEDEIRESFLMEKLRLYTMTLAAKDIKDSPTAPTDSSSSSSDDDEQDEEAPVEAAYESSRLNDDESPDSDQDAHSEDGGHVHEFMDESGSHVVLPAAGECRHDFLPVMVKKLEREVPNGCAICLSVFEPGDAVTWSSNADCHHCFHHECILNWLMASGRKYLRRQRRLQERRGLVYSQDPIEKLTTCPMQCPCCRQDFVVSEASESDDEKASVGVTLDATTTSPVAVVVGDENV